MFEIDDINEIITYLNNLCDLNHISNKVMSQDDMDTYNNYVQYESSDKKYQDEVPKDIALLKIKEMNMIELKVLCKDLKLSTTGNKTALYNRLHEYYQSQ